MVISQILRGAQVFSQRNLSLFQLLPINEIHWVSSKKIVLVRGANVDGMWEYLAFALPVVILLK